MAYMRISTASWAICLNGCDPNEHADKRPTKPRSTNDSHAVIDGDGHMFWSDWNVMQWCPRCGGHAAWTEVWLHRLWSTV